MTDERNALLRGIRESPEDDAPRLVFADWLNEHPEDGQAEWAALIRRQIAAAHIPRTDPVFWDFWSWVDRPARAAVALVPTNLRKVARYDRGLPDGLRMPSAHFLQSARMIADSPAPFTRLHLTGAGTDTSGIVARPELGQFRRLVIEGTRFGDTQARLLTQCPHLAQLAALSVDENLTPSGISGIIASPTLAGLRELSLRGDFGESTWWPWQCATSARPLERLSLSGTDNRRALAALFDTPALGNLRHLSLSLAVWLERVIYLLMAGVSPHLETLRVSGNALWRETDFFRSACFRGLRRLCMLGDTDAAIWASPVEAGPPNLSLECRPRNTESGRALAFAQILARCSELHLDCTAMSADNLIALVRSEHIRHLRVLCLTSRVPFAGRLAGGFVAALAGSPHLAGLLELQLPPCGLDDAGLRALTRGTFADSLRALSLGWCSRLSDPEVARLADPGVFPNLKVLGLEGDNFRDPVSLNQRLRERFGRSFELST